jgi:hypothetical protein
MSGQRFASFKSFLVQAAAGVVAAGVGALIFVPDQKLELGSLAIGLLSIPLFLALGALASALYGFYLIIRIVEAIAVKFNILDLDDLS